MTQEDKQLLLQYLSTALSYNVAILADIDKTFNGGVVSQLKVINLKKDWFELEGVLTPFLLEEIKPYLRPMSSMTEEEKKEFNNIPSTKNYQIVNGDLPWDVANYKQINWLLKKHFDFMGLIPMGLAIEVTEENNPYKE